MQSWRDILFNQFLSLSADECEVFAQKIMEDEELAVMTGTAEIRNWLEDRAVELREEEYEDE